MNPEDSFPCSQKLASKPYSEAHVSIPYLSILYPKNPQ